MNNTILHNMNRIHTFIDVESGQFISLPKDLTDKPPVNADINNNIDTFHSTGGEGTPDNPIPLVNVSEWNKTVCGRNLLEIGAKADWLFNPDMGSINFNIADNTVKPYIMSGNAAWVFHKTKYYGKEYFYNYKTVLVNEKSALIRVFNSNDINISNTTTVPGWTYNAYYNAFVKSMIDGVSISIPDINVNYFIIGFAAVSGAFTGQTETFYDIILSKGLEAVTYTPYQGNTYPYQLEDINGVLHYGGDLPDGTADSVNWETREFAERKGVKVLDGVTETWILGDVETGYTTFTTPLNELARPIEYFTGHSVYYGNGSPPTFDIRPAGVGNDAIIAIVEVDPNTTYFIKKFEPASNRLRIVGLTDYPLLDSEPQVPEQIMGLFDGENEAIVTTESNINYLVIYVSAEGIHSPLIVSKTPLETDSNSLRCSHFPTVLTDNNLISCDGTALTLQINTTVLPTQTVQALNTWLGLNNVTVQYKLETPVTYQIKQYGETYGGAVWEYNEKPKSIQYHTNIFTDKNITMQCEVRKLGNRKMGEFYWVAETGDKITTEDGDYIMLEY